MTLLPITYADPTPDGVVAAFEFAADGRAVLRAIGDVPPLEHAGGGFAWVHLNLVDRRSRDWLTAHPALGDKMVAALCDTGTHQRLDVADGMVAGAFIDMALEIGRESDDAAQLGFILAPSFLITGRRKPVRSVELVKAAVAGGETAATPLDLLMLIVDAELDLLDAAVTDLGNRVETIENKLLSDPIADQRRTIVKLRRRAFDLNRQVYAMLALFRSAGTRRRVPLSMDIVDAFADVVHRLEATHQELQSIKEGARLLHEETASNLTIETNRQLYILSMLTAVFLPATLVTGFFGMNTVGFIETEPTLTATLIGIAAAALVYVMITRVLRPK